MNKVRKEIRGEREVDLKRKEKGMDRKGVFSLHIEI